MMELPEKSNLEVLREFVIRDPAEHTPEMIGLRDLLMGNTISVPHIYVSSGTSGRVAGSDLVMEEIRSYLKDRRVECKLHHMGPLGLGKSEPVMAVQMPGKYRVYFRNVTAERVHPVLNDILHKNIPFENLLGQLPVEGCQPWKQVPLLSDHPFFAMQTRHVLKLCGVIDPFSIEEYIARGGYRDFLKSIRHYTFEEISDIVESSGLRGRAGSGYPTGKKWKISFNTPADQRYLICNAEESDPGAFMDRAIMEGNPHMLLEGIMIAAYGTAASRAIIYIRSEYTEAIQTLEKAIRDLREFGLLGHNIFGSGFNLDIAIRKGPGAFVCGEETALIRSLEGKRGMPVSKPPYPAVSGLHGYPTTINNVETLSNVPLIISRGPKWFRETGVENNYGTKIFAISGKAEYQGLIEVPLGTRLKELINGCEGGKDFKAIQLGGPSGFTLPATELDIPLTYEAMSDSGIRMGSGGIVVLDEDCCIPDLIKYYMNFMEKQSCGKCIPCREGTRRMSEILGSITRKPNDENGSATLERFKGVMQLESLAEVMKDTSLCGLGMMAPNPVLSSLKHFREEYEEHIFDRKCKSNICTELRTYYIEVEACTGCSICAKKCPVQAIFGTELHPYFIVQEKCIGCGICMEACKFSAVKYN